MKHLVGNGTPCCDQYTKISSISIYNEQAEKGMRKTVSFTIASKIFLFYLFI
jgi:hypothetical protein